MCFVLGTRKRVCEETFEVRFEPRDLDDVKWEAEGVTY